jgi:hypothetical protein
MIVHILIMPLFTVHQYRMIHHPSNLEVHRYMNHYCSYHPQSLTNRYRRLSSAESRVLAL